MLFLLFKNLSCFVALIHHSDCCRFPWRRWSLLPANRLCLLKWRPSSSNSWRTLLTAGRCIVSHGKPRVWWVFMFHGSLAAVQRVDPSAVPLSAGLPWVLQRAVPVSAHPRGLGALLLLAEQPEGVLSGRAVSESRGGRRLQRSHERHRRGPALVPEGHRFPHGQLTARRLLVRNRTAGSPTPTTTQTV